MPRVLSMQLCWNIDRTDFQLEDTCPSVLPAAPLPIPPLLWGSLDYHAVQQLKSMVTSFQDPFLVGVCSEGTGHCMLVNTLDATFLQAVKTGKGLGARRWCSVSTARGGTLACWEEAGQAQPPLLWPQCNGPFSDLWRGSQYVDCFFFF